jgi:membrane protein YqaA with SNARE-associated domain
MTAELNLSPLYARFERHSASNGSLVIACLWGLAEATLFFIVPDVYVAFVALFHWRKGLLATLAAVAGAMIGGATMYTLAVANDAAINSLLVRIPLISPELVRSVAEQTQGSGLVAMISAPLRGIPYKIYAVQAGQQHLPFIPFLLVTIAARLERFLPITLAGIAFGAAFKELVQRRTALVVGAYALLWLAVYVVYYLQMR